MSLVASLRGAERTKMVFIVIVRSLRTARNPPRVGANVDFPKYFEKYDRLVRKEKFPEIYHTCDKILLFIYEYSSQSYCAHSAHVALVDDR